MARDTHFFAIAHVAGMIGENLELLEEIAANSDNVDYGEIVHVTTGPDDGFTVTARLRPPAKFIRQILCSVGIDVGNDVVSGRSGICGTR